MAETCRHQRDILKKSKLKRTAPVHKDWVLAFCQETTEVFVLGVAFARRELHRGAHRGDENLKFGKFMQMYRNVEEKVLIIENQSWKNDACE
jgi:hypothetical protein